MPLRLSLLLVLVALAFSTALWPSTPRAENVSAAPENFIVGTWTHHTPGSVVMLRLRFGRDKTYEIALLDPKNGRPDKSAPETGTWEMIEPGKIRINGWRGRMTDVPFRIVDATTMIYDGERCRRAP